MAQTVPDEDHGTGRAGAPPSHRWGPVRAGLLAAVVLVAGLLIGALTAGLLSGGPVVVPADPARGAAAGAVPGGNLPGGVSGEVLVSGACLDAVNAAQDAFLVVDDLGEAAAALDAARLDEIVRQLMPVQDRLEAGLEACEVSTEVDPDRTGSTPQQDPSPGGSPAPGD